MAYGTSMASVALALVLACPGAVGAQDQSDKTQLISFPRVGQIRPRPASEITASDWSIGGETLDRDFAVYANYKRYLGPLGAKAIRLQAGWAKCESSPGVYNFAWLDEIVDDALAQSVRPWLELSYGNPIYPEGGGTGLGASLPKSPAAMRAWDAWVKALVEHFSDRVSEWEIWNEPDGAPGMTPAAFAEFHLHTAAIVRRAQPSSRIFALALASPHRTEFPEALLNLAKHRGQLDLIDAITIHGYPPRPEDIGALKKLRELVAGYSPGIQIRQGETGAPSGKTVGALRDLEWSERRQAKWNLRRMLVHHGNGVPFNLFTLCELKYRQPGMTGFNRKGLLRCNDNLTVAEPKLAYFAAQRVFSIFDDRFELASDVKVVKASQEQISLFGYRERQGRGTLLTVWRSGGQPRDEDEVSEVDLRVSGAQFTDPVYADLMTGHVYELPQDHWSARDGEIYFQRLPLYDAPIIVGERSTLPLEAIPPSAEK